MGFCLKSQSRKKGLNRLTKLKGVSLIRLIERQKIKAIKAEHPFWGYRRVMAWLRYMEDIKVNQKRIYKLMKGNGLW